jgi:MraZ protein
MFRGRFEHAIDNKGRLSIPSKFREILTTNFDERLIITNFDGCLWAYPAAEWQRVEDKVASLPQMQDAVKAFQRVFISAAVEAPIDGSGRIQIPQTLREYAGITKDVILVGMTNRIEIWSREKWQMKFDESQKKLEMLGDKLAELGL